MKRSESCRQRHSRLMASAAAPQGRVPFSPQHRRGSFIDSGSIFISEFLTHSNIPIRFRLQFIDSLSFSQSSLGGQVQFTIRVGRSKEALHDDIDWAPPRPSTYAPYITTIIYVEGTRVPASLNRPNLIGSNKNSHASRMPAAILSLLIAFLIFFANFSWRLCSFYMLDL